LPEALARSHNDSILSRSARPTVRKDRDSFARAIMRRLLSRPARTIAGATLAAILTGIVVNALVLQQARHSAPFFAAPKLAPAMAPPPASPAPAIAESAPVVALPPVRPANLGAAVDPTPLPPSRAGDPIRDLLRGDADKEATHLTIAAQNALIKLGYSIKADGVVGASTEQAIQQFEHAHGLAPSIEITAKLVRQLGAAANAAAR
jgi:Putative peptidoglycan binding domain